MAIAGLFAPQATAIASQSPYDESVPFDTVSYSPYAVRYYGTVSPYPLGYYPYPVYNGSGPPATYGLGYYPYAVPTYSYTAGYYPPAAVYTRTRAGGLLPLRIRVLTIRILARHRTKLLS